MPPPLCLGRHTQLGSVAVEKGEIKVGQQKKIVKMSRKNSEDGSAPACDTISHHVIPTERAGALSVWVQGDLSLVQKAESRDSCCCFMTVHDVGVNHNSWLRFANSPAMAPIREKAVFLHVDLLGQEDGAKI